MPSRVSAPVDGFRGVLGAVHRRLGASLEAELGEQPGDVVLDGLLGQVQLRADLAVRQALRDEVEDLLLAVGEGVGARPGIRSAGVPRAGPRVPVRPLLSSPRP